MEAYMQAVATVESLWRYPVKSMQGEQLESVVIGSSGLYGDRVYAIHDTAAPADFPYLTARQREQMLLFRPRFREHAQGAIPMVDVETPEGAVLGIDEPALLAALGAGLRDPERHQLSLLRSERAITDAYPVSLFSLQTARQLGDEVGLALDKRRFRANLYLDLGADAEGFGEDLFVGRSLQIGPTVVLAVVDRDPRCTIITLDPESGAQNPDVMKRLARAHEGRAGIYASVVTEGVVRVGNPVFLVG
jgi:uncharacterized protein YcbX